MEVKAYHYLWVPAADPVSILGGGVFLACDKMWPKGMMARVTTEICQRRLGPNHWTAPANLWVRHMPSVVPGFQPNTLAPGSVIPHTHFFT